jgi:hypothetical protein
MTCEEDAINAIVALAKSGQPAAAGWAVSALKGDLLGRIIPKLADEKQDNAVVRAIVCIAERNPDEAVNFTVSLATTGRSEIAQKITLVLKDNLKAMVILGFAKHGLNDLAGSVMTTLVRLGESKSIALIVAGLVEERLGFAEDMISHICSK